MSDADNRGSVGEHAYGAGGGLTRFPFGARYGLYANYLVFMNSVMRERLRRGNFVFVFVVGVILGVIGKNAMFANVRIGYQDPQTVLPVEETLYGLDEAQRRVAAKAAALMDAPPTETEDGDIAPAR